MASPLVLSIGLVAVAIWVWLLVARGGYWRLAERLDADSGSPPPQGWPAVTAVVPARNEAATIADCLAGLLAQDYPGPFDIVLVDDASEDGTAAIAQRLAGSAGARADGHGLAILSAPPLPAGWSGKLWALNAGIGESADRPAPAPWLLLTDADIRHDPGSLVRMVAVALDRRADLVSVMVRLWAERGWARLLIPAFVYFFAKLYPFAWVNNPARRTAAAAGGAILVRRAALAETGGLSTMRDALIDDVTLARRIKRRPSGRPAIHLAHSARVESLRPYARLAPIWAMVARTAYTELDHAPLRLAGTVVGLAVTYLVPPVLALGGLAAGAALPAAIGAIGWALMAASFSPALRASGQTPWLAPALPVAAFLYALMTLDSARQHYRGRGGHWKGRVQGRPSS